MKKLTKFWDGYQPGLELLMFAPCQLVVLGFIRSCSLLHNFHSQELHMQFTHMQSNTFIGDGN